MDKKLGGKEALCFIREAHGRVEISIVFEMKAGADLAGGLAGSFCFYPKGKPSEPMAWEKRNPEGRLTKSSCEGEVGVYHTLTLMSDLSMNLSSVSFTTKFAVRFFLPVLTLFTCSLSLRAEAPAVPDWAQPGSATHKQVPPPVDFHRASNNSNTPIGLFEGQSDIGGAVIPGSTSYDPGTKQYIINSAGYNIWYTRDEFRYLWKKASGDVSLATDIAFPNPDGYGDRKVVLIIRQNLDDDSKEIMTALHGAGLIHLAQRPEKGADIKEDYRTGGTGTAGQVPILAKRIGIEKQGDSFALFVSLKGEPMHQVGPAAKLHFEEPFYVGIGFCSHLPDKSDTAVVSNVVLENSAGKIR